MGLAIQGTRPGRGPAQQPSHDSMGQGQAKGHGMGGPAMHRRAATVLADSRFPAAVPRNVTKTENAGDRQVREG